MNSEDESHEAPHSAEPAEPQVSVVGLVGPVNSGKSVLTTGLRDCTQLKWHGYQWDLKAQVKYEYKGFVDDAEQELPDGTTVIRPMKYVIEIPEAEQPSSKREIEIRDTPGESVFEWKDDEGEKDADVPSYDEIMSDFAEADVEGIVVVLSFEDAGRSERFSELGRRIEDWIYRATNAQEGQNSLTNLKRIVIAINKLDLPLTRFGPYALEVAVQPDMVLEVLQSHLRNARHAIRRYFPESDDEIEIRFIATSSFGFLPEFGCSNVDLELMENSDSRSRGPADSMRFAYLAVDPFVYAATGEGNAFFFSREEILAH